MKLPDPLKLKLQQPKISLRYVCLQENGARSRQEDAYRVWNDECFALADGLGGFPHGDVAASIAVESAVWAVQLAKRKPFYWHDKKLLGGRIFRSANWRVYNKRREDGFSEGLASTLLVLLFSDRKYYLYHAGDTEAFCFRNKALSSLTKPDRDMEGGLTKVLGIQKQSPVPSLTIDEYLPGDIFLLATDGVVDWVGSEDIQMTLSAVTMDVHSLENAATTLLSYAKKSGSTDNQTVFLIRCIASGDMQETVGLA